MKSKIDTPLISVIVPVYNTERFLDCCLESIRVQTYKNLQVIMVDDGSTDHSLEICTKYVSLDSRFEIVKKQNGGLSSARNAGLKRVKGSYIGFIDSDDFIRNTMYEELLGIIPDKNGISCTGTIRVSESESACPDHTQMKSPQNGESYARDLLLYTGDSSVCTKLFPRELFDNYSFDETVLNEDFKLMILMSERIDKICYTNNCCYCYRLRQGSITSGYSKATEDSVRNAIWAKYFIKENYPNLQKESRSFALYQHMIYLMVMPRKKASHSNIFYTEAIKYIRKNYFRDGLLNECFKFFPKIVVLSQVVSPRISALAYFLWKKLRALREK